MFEDFKNEVTKLSEYIRANAGDPNGLNKEDLELEIEAFARTIQEEVIEGRGVLFVPPSL